MFNYQTIWPRKIQFMIRGDTSHQKHVLKTNRINIESSGDVLLQRITIDKKINF